MFVGNRGGGNRVGFLDGSFLLEFHRTTMLGRPRAQVRRQTSLKTMARPAAPHAIADAIMLAEFASRYANIV